MKVSGCGGIGEDCYSKVVLLLLILLPPVWSVGLKIDLRVGSVQGGIEKVQGSADRGKNYASFSGIPYAEPPVGKLRFKDPVEKPLWEGVLDVSQKGKIECLQLGRDVVSQRQDSETIIGVEDCLVLNVYAPLDEKDELFLSPLPVMVWIHGGGFVRGNGGTDFYGPDFFMSSENPVILVTLNYRLGILGFLSLGDDVVTGNMGLKDQTLALKWVQENIAKFGGDPNRVTIFGESAGGRSVMAHILSPWSKDLFHQAIVQSGAITDLRNLIPSHPPEYYARQVLEDLEVEDDLDQLDSLQLLQILQKVPANQIVQRNGLFEEFMFALVPWKPIVDGNHASKPFIPDDPRILLAEGNFNKVPIITGGNQDEGTFFLTQFLANEDLFEEVHENFDVKGPFLLLGVCQDDVTEEDTATAHLIKNEYLDGLHTNFTKDNWQRIAKIFGDIIYLVPLDIEARSLVENSDQPVYYYRNKYKGGLSVPPMLLASDQEKLFKSYDFGVSHADELFLLFRQTGLLSDRNEILRTEKDQLMIKKLIRLWTSFASKGQPDEPEWHPLTKDNHKWAQINRDGSIKMAWDEDFEHKVEFVRSMFEVLVGYRNMIFHEHPAAKEMLNRPGDPEEAIELNANRGPSEEDIERMMLEPELGLGHKLHEEL